MTIEQTIYIYGVDIIFIHTPEKLSYYCIDYIIKGDREALLQADRLSKDAIIPQSFFYKLKITIVNNC
ncbi:hypothetical protein NWP21_10070 [Anabaenopsis sp. FSS-46]|uniref:hypothetical protein n=1 Tax=Anabaenopsis sp. FSS-46 TaxID=2971766 RepID=UPI002475F5CB|nr:hypothetical protein [Anabaenopsis sp. FSS-46]MDH6099179.1 hypothetical protein [Anabaenopsis sp. FSS-46]